MLRSFSTTLQIPRSWPDVPDDGRPTSISASSPGLTAGCSAGESLTYHHQTPARTKAIGAVTTNDRRHPTLSNSHAMRGPVAAEPSVRPAFCSPVGNAHPPTGNQLQVVRPPVTG